MAEATLAITAITLIIAIALMYAIYVMLIKVTTIETRATRNQIEVLDEITECKRIMSKNKYQNYFNKREQK